MTFDDDDDAPNIPDILDCRACDGFGAWYGVAPHSHDTTLTRYASSTIIEPKEKWPDNFHEDMEAPGCGVWVCPTCDGAGKVENPIAMIDNELDEDGDPWPFGDVIELVGDMNDDDADRTEGGE